MVKAGRSTQKAKASGPARRFPLDAHVRYRSDDGRWHQGRTMDMSSSGLLLQAEEALTPNTAIEFVVELPPTLAGRASGHVVCRGQVVRTVEEQATCAFVAATITHYRIDRPPTLLH
jgi:hypothetical protein